MFPLSVSRCWLHHSLWRLRFLTLHHCSWMFKFAFWSLMNVPDHSLADICNSHPLFSALHSCSNTLFVLVESTVDRLLLKSLEKDCMEYRWSPVSDGLIHLLFSKGLTARRKFRCCWLCFFWREEKSNIPNMAGRPFRPPSQLVARMKRLKKSTSRSRRSALKEIEQASCTSSRVERLQQYDSQR